MEAEDIDPVLVDIIFKAGQHVSIDPIIDQPIVIYSRKAYIGPALPVFNIKTWSPPDPAGIAMKKYGNGTTLINQPLTGRIHSNAYKSSEYIKIIVISNESEYIIIIPKSHIDKIKPILFKEEQQPILFKEGQQPILFKAGQRVSISPITEDISFLPGEGFKSEDSERLGLTLKKWNEDTQQGRVSIDKEIVGIIELNETEATKSFVINIKDNDLSHMLVIPAHFRDKITAVMGGGYRHKRSGSRSSRIRKSRKQSGRKSKRRSSRKNRKSRS